MAEATMLAVLMAELAIRDDVIAEAAIFDVVIAESTKFCTLMAEEATRAEVIALWTMLTVLMAEAPMLAETMVEAAISTLVMALWTMLMAETTRFCRVPIPTAPAARRAEVIAEATRSVVVVPSTVNETSLET